MADRVEQVLQDMVPELDDLRRKNIFSEKEIRQIVKRRRDFEYSLQRMPGQPQDYLNYVRYEIALENLRRRRSDALRWRKRTISDNAGVVRVHKILRRASFRYKGDVRMWYQHLDFCLRSGSSRVLTHVLMSALKYHPQEVSLWLLSADRELQQGHVDAARKLLFRGLRCAPSSVKLLVEFLRLELGVAGQILQVRQLDAEAGLVEAKVEPDVKDVWGPAKLLFRKALAKLAGDVVDTATFLRASAELKRGASKWSHTDGFQEWADMLREAAASKRPGVDGAADDQVPPEAAAAIWEVWWTQELEAGTAWPQLAKSVAACGVGRVLARCAQVMQSQLEASELGPLQKLAEANATSADPETALTMLEVLSSVPSKKLQAAYDALRSKAADRHPQHLRLALLAGKEAIAFADASAADACLALSHQAPNSAERLVALLRSLAPGEDVGRLVTTLLAEKAAVGEANAACQEVRVLAENLWDVPQVRHQVLAAVLEAELRMMSDPAKEAKKISRGFEELLGSTPQALELWLRYLEFSHQVSHLNTGVPQVAELHWRALRAVQDQAQYREQAQKLLQGLEV